VGAKPVEEKIRNMRRTVSVIGIDNAELNWIRTLLRLLRHPDPSIPELARQALTYLTDSTADREAQENTLPGNPGRGCQNL
jgi:hypothetical protein